MAYSGSYHPREEREEILPAPETAERERPAEGRPHGRPLFDLSGLFQKTEAAGMETDDLLMALILYLMYRESGDKDLLIMLGAILLT